MSLHEVDDIIIAGLIVLTLVEHAFDDLAVDTAINLTRDGWQDTNNPPPLTAPLPLVTVNDKDIDDPPPQLPTQLSQPSSITVNVIVVVNVVIVNIVVVIVKGGALPL
ncbi:hypothetical protein B0T26DRAFT_869837 [Lasiosphaeria miniovina]|uniref:Uncharacterized protein n=1 Tax=Lasiosphaeria miniovina TaxID=1954250 RepID=A0AA40B739_9PEZI|nr:uncharacterized protein B0T26DRAFT_869837 [Lasiosphaeria miniovina]KAK0728891.1 hypothetical protein B0T26DRAFT_869837 [Lasiosphaeria miniovina]